MSQLRELAVKSITALRVAEARGVRQIKGSLGRTDGCRCAEGVIADVLIDEGILGRIDDGDSWFKYYPLRGIGSFSETLRELLPADLVLLGFALSPYESGSSVSIYRLNDSSGWSFGQIADQMQKSLDAGFYDGGED